MNTLDTIKATLLNSTLRQLRAVRRYAFNADIFVAGENPGMDELIDIVSECADEQELSEILFSN